MSVTSENNRRIAKNTLLLYFRMLLMMLIALYTSRVTLQALGVEDFGIYNVVGGLVSMGSIFVGAVSIAIQRFITFELGQRNQQKLNIVFSTSLILQLVAVIVVLFVFETVGLWFLDNELEIPEARINAAHVIYHFSIFTFCLSLCYLPYNACIIAHERMKAFAYMSIIEVVAKLGIVYVIMLDGFDKLIVYGMLLMIIQTMVVSAYLFYCHRNFEECRLRFTFDRNVVKEMFGYAGWTYIGAGSALLRDAGGNILINMFYGPVANASRGIAIQVQNAVNQFATNFMTALNPQITKNYAAGNYDYMKYLIFNGSRISCYMLMFLSLPILLNTEYILQLWLGQQPQYASSFVRLALLFVFSEAISTPLVTSASASGKIRNYQLLVGGLQSLNFPLSWLLLFLGCPPYITFVVAIIVSQMCLCGRLYILRNMINLPSRLFIKNVYCNIIVTTLVGSLLPFIFYLLTDKNLNTFVCSCFLSMLSMGIAIFYVGCNGEERIFIRKKIKELIRKIHR